MVIGAYNPETSQLEKTYISQYTAAASSSLSVRNSNKFVSAQPILIGKMGAERSEILVAGTISSATAIPVASNTVFPHTANDPVYALLWNKIRIYRASSISGSYSLIATIDIDVDNADKITRYDDTAGAATDYYKTAFYNSVSAVEDTKSDPISAAGDTLLTAGKVISQVVRRVRDTNYLTLGQAEYLDIMQEVNDDLTTQMRRPYRFLKRTVTLNTVAGTNYIDIATAVPDFWKFNYMTYTYTVGGVSRTYEFNEPLSLEDFQRKYLGASWTNSDMLIDVAIDEEQNRILLGPTPLTSQTGVLRLSYYKKFTTIDSIGDVVETPNTLIYKYKMMAEFYTAKAEVDAKWAPLAGKYEQKYGNEVVKMQRVNRLDVGTPRSFAPKKVPSMRKRFIL